jgi:hypothetical protein
VIVYVEQAEAKKQKPQSVKEVKEEIEGILEVHFDEVVDEIKEIAQKGKEIIKDSVRNFLNNIN